MAVFSTTRPVWHRSAQCMFDGWMICGLLGGSSETGSHFFMCVTHWADKQLPGPFS